MTDVVDTAVAPRLSAQPRSQDVAARQWGLISRRQLLACGASEGGIAHRLRTAGLHRVHRGVYAFTAAALCPEARWMAAVLACGGGAVLSHYSAAAAWRLLRDEIDRAVDVTVAGGGRRAADGINPHRTRHLPRSSLTVVRAIPATTVSRTLIDLAEVAPDNHLRRAVDEADRLGWLNLRDLDQQADGAHGRHGLPRLQRLMRRHRPSGFSRSDLERRFLTLAAAAGLSRPLINQSIEGHEVDFQWPDRRLVVEVDGYEWHRTRARFVADRARDRALTRVGWRVLRVPDETLEDDPCAVEADLRALAGQRS